MPSLWWALANSSTGSAVTAIGQDAVSVIKLGDRVHFEVAYADTSEGWVPDAGSVHHSFDVDDVPERFLKMDWEPLHSLNKSAIDQLGDLSNEPDRQGEDPHLQTRAR